MIPAAITVNFEFLEIVALAFIISVFFATSLGIMYNIVFRSVTNYAMHKSQEMTKEMLKIINDDGGIDLSTHVDNLQKD